WCLRILFGLACLLTARDWSGDRRPADPFCWSCSALAVVDGRHVSIYCSDRPIFIRVFCVRRSDVHRPLDWVHSCVGCRADIDRRCTSANPTNAEVTYQNIATVT